MAKIIPTSALPFAMVDALPYFTIFPNAERAQPIADGLAAQYVADGLEGTEFVVSVRADGKALVTAIEAADEVCWHVPAEMLKAAA